MSLIKWTPMIPDGFGFEDFDNMLTTVSGKNNSFAPAIDMYEEEKDIIVETQLAGIDPEKVSISIENDTLCLQGEGEKRTEVDEKNYYRKEIRRGSFFRSIPLPAKVNGDKAVASIDKGVLRISIPKTLEKKAKAIKINISKNK